MKLPFHILVLLAAIVVTTACGRYPRKGQLEQRAKYSGDQAVGIQTGVQETDNRVTEEANDSSEQTDSPAAFSPAEILRNMPVNSEMRCVGISLVAAALLEGRIAEGEGCDEPAELGRRIYDGALQKARTHYHAKLCLNKGAAPIQSREALEELSTTVADLYKQRHLELIASEPGRQRLRAVMTKVVGGTAELDSVLDADPDKIDTFFCVGMRRFPDGTFKDTNHAILIAKTPEGDKVVYDPNDPGEAIACRLQDIDDGLEITWRCRFRDTGQITTQRYHILRRDTLFRLALAKEDDK